MDTQITTEGLDQETDPEAHPSEDSVEDSIGDENEAPSGVFQSVSEAELQVRYAKAKVRFRAAKHEYEAARTEIVTVIQALGSDQDNVLSERLATPIPFYELPLPMTFRQIKEYTGWDTKKANNWLKYRVKTGKIKKRGERKHYVYYYPADPLGEGYARTRD